MEEFQESFKTWIEASHGVIAGQFFKQVLNHFTDTNELNFIVWFRLLYKEESQLRMVDSKIMMVLFENKFDEWYETIRYERLKELE